MNESFGRGFGALSGSKLVLGRAIALGLAAMLGVCSSAAGDEAPPGGPLTLGNVSLTATDGRLALRVETVAPWLSSDVASTGDRTLCVLFWTGDLATPRSRICLEGRQQRLVIRYQRLGPDGATLFARTLPAAVVRPDERTATASFTPAAIGIRQSVFYWQAVSRWTDPASCPDACSDHVPLIGRQTVDLGADSESLAAQFVPQVHPDSRDTPGGPLDVRRVAFGQQDAQVSLDLRTQGRWATRDLLRGGRSLCVVLDREEPPRTVGRLCVGPDLRDTVLRYQPVDDNGRAGAWLHVSAAASRPDDRSVLASFSASAIGLPMGAFTWALQTHWRDDSACRAGCEDRVPDSGVFAGSVNVLAQPHCFGAAARDPLHLCRNPVLRYAAFPSPSVAQISTNAPCRLVDDPRRSAVLHPCEFGVTGVQRTATIALIGDSHAEMWRAAVDVVAQAKRWRGVSIARPGCPFSTQVPRSPDLGPAACAQLHRETLAWLGAHSEIHTILIADWAEPASGPMGGTSGYGGDASAFGAMLDRVPRSVRRIYVLRDIPGTNLSTASCVTANRDRHRPLAGACATPRSADLTADPGVAAALSRRPRVRVIDLTRFFCGPTRCYPVIGGGYVYRDDNHMNAVFSTSLGPFVLRALDAG